MEEFITSPQRAGRIEGFHIGLQKGEANILIRLLQRRFGQLPRKHLKLIQRADAETLLIWAERILTAASLDQILS